mmetsp:Transcript_19222/g.32428  ORF Transcript_19222/g.32428 Transcript_19222/m.32428 type:complete len:86 (-) Transcript_19222:1915-2172(-)
MWRKFVSPSSFFMKFSISGPLGCNIIQTAITSTPTTSITSANSFQHVSNEAQRRRPSLCRKACLGACYRYRRPSSFHYNSFRGGI